MIRTGSPSLVAASPTGGARSQSSTSPRNCGTSPARQPMAGDWQDPTVDIPEGRRTADLVFHRPDGRPLRANAATALACPAACGRAGLTVGPLPCETLRRGACPASETR